MTDSVRRRSYTYIKFNKPIDGCDWKSIDEGDRWHSFHKDLWNRCRQSAVPQLEEYVSSDTEYLLTIGMIEPDEVDDEDNREDWFVPDDVLKTTEKLQASLQKREPEMNRTRLARFVRSLNEWVRRAKEANALIHLAWDPLEFR